MIFLGGWGNWALTRLPERGVFRKFICEHQQEKRRRGTACSGHTQWWLWLSQDWVSGSSAQLPRALNRLPETLLLALLSPPSRPLASSLFLSPAYPPPSRFLHLLLLTYTYVSTRLICCHAHTQLGRSIEPRWCHRCRGHAGIVIITQFWQRLELRGENREREPDKESNTRKITIRFHKWRERKKQSKIIILGEPGTLSTHLHAVRVSSQTSWLVFLWFHSLSTFLFESIFPLSIWFFAPVFFGHPHSEHFPLFWAYSTKQDSKLPPAKYPPGRSLEDFLRIRGETRLFKTRQQDGQGKGGGEVTADKSLILNNCSWCFENLFSPDLLLKNPQCTPTDILRRSPNARKWSFQLNYPFYFILNLTPCLDMESATTNNSSMICTIKPILIDS